ncbi:MAG: glucosaminidase domain-containing protein [Selenomonadaceae bacterium]|nr:glucosaminidase domain-containing protein [Selenomonadaceae bacterium]
MTIKKFLTIILTIMIFTMTLTTTEAAKKIKFDKKKLAAAELVDAVPKLDPLMMINESPESVTILGDPIATQGQMVKYIQKRNSKPLLNCTVRQIVQLYYEEAGRENIRADIAICQALKETGFFGYGGDVDPSQNNYCGLGATGNHEPGLKFDSPQLGVRAHIQHLLAYASTQPPKIALVDPRYTLVRDFRKDIFGKSIHWLDLNGRWAVPGTHYGQEILRYWQQAQMPDSSAESLMAANRNIKLNAPTAEMFVYRGLVYFARGEEGNLNDYYNAIDDFESAILLAPNSSEAIYNLAITYEKLNKNKEAIETYDRLTEINDEFIQAFYNRGRLKLLNGDYDNAISDFERVLELEPITADAKNEIAIAHFKQKKYQEAYEDINVAYDINDRNETVLANKEILDSCIKKKK